MSYTVCFLETDAYLNDGGAKSRIRLPAVINQPKTANKDKAIKNDPAPSFRARTALASERRLNDYRREYRWRYPIDWTRIFASLGLVGPRRAASHAEAKVVIGYFELGTVDVRTMTLTPSVQARKGSCRLARAGPISKSRSTWTQSVPGCHPPRLRRRKQPAPRSESFPPAKPQASGSRIAAVAYHPDGQGRARSLSALIICSPGGQAVFPLERSGCMKAPSCATSDVQTRIGLIYDVAEPAGTAGLNFSRSGAMNTKREAQIVGSFETKAILLVSQLRFVMEMLRELLERSASFHVRSTAATLEDALEVVRADAPAIVLMDAAFPGGKSAAEQLCKASPRSALIAFGLREIEVDVIAWAEAGMAGYVPNTASVDDMIACIENAYLGEQLCSSRIASSLLRYVARARQPAPPPPTSALTLREREVLKLVGAGLSNKDIARRLSISLGTTKSHVHSLLSKLHLSRRADVTRQGADAY